MVHTPSLSRSFVEWSLITAYFGSGIIIILLMSSSAAKVGNLFLDGDGWNIRNYIMIFLILVILIGQIRELKYLVPFSALANVFIVCALGITLFYVFQEPISFDGKENIAEVSQMVRILIFKNFPQLN